MARQLIVLRFVAALALACPVLPALAQTTPSDQFRQSCASCHTIGGGRLVGPDLKNVTQRKDRAWLTNFVQNPRAAIDAGDAYALQLQHEAQGVVMPTLGLDAGRIEAMLAFLDAESKLPRSQFAGMQVSDRPFTPQDVVAGRALFTGAQRLKNGGPACISCHTIRGLGGLSGGRLGPDLTLAYERLQGRKGLTAWLTNPASPTMMPIFKPTPIDPNEILPLVAMLESTAKQGGQDDSTARLNFALIGVGGLVAGLVALDSVWKRRLRGVRRALLERNRGEQ
jgi:mono/diheme cytochrome c family protein